MKQSLQTAQQSCAKHVTSNDVTSDTAPNSYLANENGSASIKPVMPTVADEKKHPCTNDSEASPNDLCQPCAAQLVKAVEKIHLDHKTCSLGGQADHEIIGVVQTGVSLDSDLQLSNDVKESSSPAKCSDGTSSIRKTSGSAKISERLDYVESGKSSMCRGSTSTDVSDESSCSSFISSLSKPHKANDSRWEAIQLVRSREGVVGLNHFRLLKRLGCGDIGSVYLSELSGTKSYFAMKVMDKVSLASRKKLLRAQTEREILQLLDHPFLPTLYTHFETDKFSCLVMEFAQEGTCTLFASDNVENIF